MNVSFIRGRLGQDPELTWFESGKVKTKLSVAVGKDNPSWFEVELWGKNAENAAQYLHKGSFVAVNGEMRFSEWTDKNGEVRGKFYIHAREIDFAGNVSPQEKAAA